MLSNWKHIIIKLFCILLFIFIFYKITDSTWFSNNNNNNNNKKSDIESFANSIENEKINYIKLKETNIDNTEVSLNLLYANYLGEETGSRIWDNKTLDQCTELCNNIEGCVGFSRDLKLDTELATCYPNNIVNDCYSNRKGNMSQMQNAIKYNSFIKSNVPNILTLCIGDSDLTLNRTIFIKSYAMPSSCLGVSGDSRVKLIESNKEKFKQSCNFRIESGLDGVGTVSFCHIDTGKYLLRDIEDNLILYNNSSGLTENKQRSSFNLYDSNVGSGSIMFKCMQIEGETNEKFITLDDNYLKIKELPSDKNYDKFTFYIIDSIVNSNIITSKKNMPESTMSNTLQTTVSTTMPNRIETTITTMPKIVKKKVSKSVSTTVPNTIKNTIPNIRDMENKKDTKDAKDEKDAKDAKDTEDTEDIEDTEEGFTVNLDNTKNIPLYNNLFSKPDNFVLTDYLEDNYMKSNLSNYTSIDNKYNNILIKNQLSNSLSKNADKYKSIYNLNLEIEREIANLNMGLNAKNDKLINGLDKMRISDMANDYFFLKNLLINK
jgi:hypothetical protein